MGLSQSDLTQNEIEISSHSEKIFLGLTVTCGQIQTSESRVRSLHASSVQCHTPIFFVLAPRTSSGRTAV